MAVRRLPLLVVPRTRGECIGGPRPCPHAWCRHRLDDGQCVLDLAERGGMTLEEIGALLHVTKEATRQIELKVLRKLRALDKLRRAMNGDE